MLDTYNNYEPRDGKVKNVAPISNGFREKSKSSRSIRLAGVHSIDRSLSSTKNITKIKTGDQQYEKIVYYEGVDPQVEITDLYHNLVSILRESNACFGFVEINKTVTKNRPQDKSKKYLLVVPEDIGKPVMDAIHE